MAIPKIRFALNGWEYPITMIKITQSIVDYETVQNEELIEFKGVVQPLKEEALQIKPLEMRSWKWLMIHTRIRIELQTNDLIEYKGERFKVMADKDYSLNNYYEYHLVKDYE